MSFFFNNKTVFSVVLFDEDNDVLEDHSQHAAWWGAGQPLWTQDDSHQMACHPVSTGKKPGS